MASKYIVRIKNDYIFEITSPNRNILIYKFPYAMLKKNKIEINDLNDFVCYILFGRNDKGKDYIYVGKSTNGLKNRQLSHEDKYKDWEDCYILTNYIDRSYFNDGTIQYIEDKLRKLIDDADVFINTTKNTNQNTIGLSDQEDCNDYILEACRMLRVLGLNLENTYNDEELKTESQYEAAKGKASGEDFINRKIYRFSFKGKVYYPSNPKEMLENMMSLIYEENKDKIKEMAKKDYKIPGAKSAVYISETREKFRSGRSGNIKANSKLDEGVYFLTCLNNNLLVTFIKCVLKECKYKNDDFFVEFE